MGESLLTGILIQLVGRSFVSGICKLKPTKPLKKPENLFFLLKT